MSENKNWTKWLYWFTFAVAVIFIYKTLDNFTEITNWISNLFSVLIPFIIGILIAYILYIPCKKFETLYGKCKNKFISKKSRGLAIITIYAIVLILIVLVINFLAPAISSSVTDLLNSIPGFISSASEYINNLPEDSIFNQFNLGDAISNASQFDLSNLLSIENITGYAKGIMGFASGIFTIFVTIIVSIYVLLERRKIINFISRLSKALFKESTYNNLENYFLKSNEIFSKFLSSQVLDGIIVGILTSIAMLLLDVEYAVLLGIMIGLFNLIPYFGAIFAVVIAILITIFTGGFTQAIWLAVVVIVLQQIDANIINPKIVGNSLKLSPLLVIFSVTVGGAYFGILGMFLAVPVIAILKIIIEEYIAKKNIS